MVLLYYSNCQRTIKGHLQEPLMVLQEGVPPRIFYSESVGEKRQVADAILQGILAIKIPDSCQLLSISGLRDLVNSTPILQLALYDVSLQLNSNVLRTNRFETAIKQQVYAMPYSVASVTRTIIPVGSEQIRKEIKHTCNVTARRKLYTIDYG